VSKPEQTAPEVDEHGFGVEAVAELEAVAVVEAAVEIVVQLAVECELFEVPEHSISSKQQTKPQL